MPGHDSLSTRATESWVLILLVLVINWVQIPTNHAEHLVSSTLAWLLTLAVLSSSTLGGHGSAKDSAHDSTKRGGHFEILSLECTAGFMLALAAVSDETNSWSSYASFFTLAIIVTRRCNAMRSASVSLDKGSATSTRLRHSISLAVCTAAWCLFANTDVSSLELRFTKVAGILAACGGFAIFAVLSDIEAEPSSSVPVTVDFERTIALWTASLLTINCLVWSLTTGIPRCNPVILVASAAVKAGQWWLCIRMAKNTSWEFSTCIAAFSGMPFGGSGGFTTWLDVSNAIVARALLLRQVSGFAPKLLRPRALIWTLVGFTVTVQLAIFGRQNKYMHNLAEHSLVDVGLVAPATLAVHPIQSLIKQAATRFENLSTQQSNSFEEASSAYIARYRRQPPTGFEEWYDAAKQHDSPIIDDFDIIDDALAPFWKISGKEVLDVMSRASQGDDSYVELCQFGAGLVASSDCNHLGPAMMGLLKEIVPGLPPVQLAFNFFDEPRVAISPLSSRARSDSAPVWTDGAAHPTWDILTRDCASTGRPSRFSDEASGLVAFSDGLPFVDDARTAGDLCRHAEYQSMHGFLLSPSTFKYTDMHVPILSTGSLSTMGDIPFPANIYSNYDFMYRPLEDKPWSEKQHALYWAGATTGGQYTDTTPWQDFQRQRFMTITQDLQHTTHTQLHRDDNNIWIPSAAQPLNTSHFTTTFTDLVQCDASVCDEIRSTFDIRPARIPQAQEGAFTLLFDIDGNGHSGRYYRLLESHSLPLKTTIFREWHDERLIPWWHYVPISLGMDELPEVVRYFVDEEEGRELARRLARNGREWAKRALRPVDQALYLARLMMELARLQDLERAAEV